MDKLDEQIVKEFESMTLREMAEPLKKIQRKLSFGEDTRDAHLFKLYFFREFTDYINGWARTVHKLAIRVNKDVKTNRFPRENELYHALFEREEDSFRDHIPAFVSMFNDKRDPEYASLPVIKSYDKNEVFLFFKNYYAWLSIEFSKKGSVTLDEVENELVKLFKEYPYSLDN